MGLQKHDQTIEHLVDLAIEVQTVRSCLTACERDPRFTESGYCVPNHAHLAVGGIAILKARQRMAEILRIVPGSSLVVCPSDRDLAAPEVAAGLEECFGGGGYTALQRSALLQMAWDHVSSALDGREFGLRTARQRRHPGLARPVAPQFRALQRARQRGRPPARHADAGDRPRQPARGALGAAPHRRAAAPGSPGRSPQPSLREREKGIAQR